jgi:hypothetical protein
MAQSKRLQLHLALMRWTIECQDGQRRQGLLVELGHYLGEESRHKLFRLGV